MSAPMKRKDRQKLKDQEKETAEVHFPFKIPQIYIKHPTLKKDC